MAIQKDPSYGGYVWLQIMRLDTSPDETRTFEHGELKTATVGDFKVAQLYGVMLPGRMKVVMDDGSEMEPGL